MIPLDRSGARRVLVVTLGVLASFSPQVRAEAQLLPPAAAMLNGPDDRSGPRFGVVWLTTGSLTADLMDRHVAPVMTLFGWQFEHQFDPPQPDMPVPVIESIGLIGGLEQNIALPSLTTIVGVRQPNGWEGGIGSLLTPSSVGLVAAAGVTRVVGNYNVPLNLAVAPGRRGVSISLTTGINERSRRR